MAFGNLNVSDLLASLRVAQGTVASFGEDNVWSAINQLLSNHNTITANMLESLCEVSTTRFGRVGSTDNMNMEELDEHGSAQPQNVTSGALQGWPLRKYGVALGWTRDWFRNATVQELAAQFTGALTADLRLIQRQIKRALYISANYSILDRLIDGFSLPVKALQNADSFPIPPGPNGEIFNAATHTHYLPATAAWSGATTAQKTADAAALVLTLVEHYNTGYVFLVINQASETDVRSLTGFQSYFDPQINKADTADTAVGKYLNMINVYNRPIGLFNGAEVWVKPWAIANYMVGYIASQDKPLRVRVRGTGKDQAEGNPTGIIGNPSPGAQTGNGDLELVADNEIYPLRCKEYRREFGVASRNRLSAAVLYLNGTSYVDPTIT